MGAQALLVTDRGRPVALLGPLPGTGDRLSQLVAAGLATPPKHDLLSLPPPHIRPTVMSSEEALAMEREERLP